VRTRNRSAADLRDPSATGARGRSTPEALGRARPAWRYTIASLVGVAGDGLALAGAAVLISLGGRDPLPAWALGAVLIIPLAATLGGCSDRRPWGLRNRNAGARGAIAQLLAVGSAAVAGAGLAGVEADSLWRTALPVMTVAVTVPITRVALRRMLTAAFGPEHVVLVGRDAAVERLARDLTGRRDVELVARAEAVKDLCGIAGGGVDHIVAGEMLARTAVDEVLGVCDGRAARVSVAAHRPTLLGVASGVEALQRVALLRARVPPAPMARALKRALDVVGAALVMVAAAPIVGVIALLVRAQSRGPALFRQARVGRDGRIFVMFKFRTMVADAEERRSALLPLSRDPGWLHLDHDPRITSVGRLLRRTSLDELPQFWNVLRGDMSLVGPRPLVALEHERAPAWAQMRSEVRPGITGLWQVEGRTTLAFQDMLRLDRVYVATWSLWGDVEILLRTVPAVLIARGAN
jgi:exopolysaccharide biosynthesis polyprenyl glycosylphosphotransferase